MPATQEQIRAAFAVFDADGNGTLSADELKRILTMPTNCNLGGALTADEYADLLAQTLNDTDATDTEIVGLRQDQPDAGTGFIITNPPNESGSER